jgi:hypothetical protein
MTPSKGFDRPDGDLADKLRGRGWLKAERRFHLAFTRFPQSQRFSI